MNDKVKKYKPYLLDYLMKYHNLSNPKRFFHCLNPDHLDTHPSMIYTDKYNICKCFSCGKSYDIFDLIGMDFKLDNFKEKIRKIEELYLEYVPIYKNSSKKNPLNDYSDYYNKCMNDYELTNYLENRGIDGTLIEKYKIGFDKFKNLVIFPINKNCYFARSTIDNTKIKSKGSSDIWNKQHLFNSGKNDFIYITEGIIDSLSLETIDSKIKTLSINGVGNIKQLVKAIKESKYNGSIVIAFDNDLAGINARDKLRHELSDMGINVFYTSLIANFDDRECKDINNALIKDRGLLERNYNFFNNTFRKILDRKNKEKGEDFILE